MLLAVTLAISVGLILVFMDGSFNQAVLDVFVFPGELWLRALKLIVLPLIFANIVTAIYLRLHACICFINFVKHLDMYSF